jgi:glutathione synthase/RimK-type ligase-like ATP-grasp enzyme
MYSNTPAAVLSSANKIRTFQALQRSNVPTLEWTDRAEIARSWVDSDGKCVARTTVNGHSGVGIHILRDANNIIPAPLYTRYWKKQKEFRVHVAFGQVILVQEKRRADGSTDNLSPDAMLIRTHANGCVFCINDLHCDSGGYREAISELAIRAAVAVGLQHGAVDILVKLSRHGAYASSVVVETNSAPALEGESTIQAYTQAFRRQIAFVNSTHQ